ncbi:MAG: hypothetical protein PHI06_10060 [Desulfobulbaceae bacterium]|nr:hypothetical protein [Desulfobulbaceae bacterium]
MSIAKIKKLSFLNSLFIATFAIPIMVAAGLACIRAVEFALFPYETSGPETYVLHGALSLLRKRALYPEVPSYIFHIYNPMSYLPAAGIGYFFEHSPQVVLLAGRIVSLVTSAMLILVVARWIWRTYRNYWSVLFWSGGMLVFSPLTLTDFSRLRPESPGLLMTWLGLLCVVSNCRWRVEGAALLFFLAFMFKQSFVSAPIAVFLALFLVAERRSAWLFLSILSGSLAAFFILMIAITGQGYFVHAIQAMAGNLLDAQQVTRILLPWLWKEFWGPILLLLPTVFLMARSSRHLSAQTRRVLVYISSYGLACTLWTLFSAAKLGASLNYFSEWAVIVLMVVAIGIAVIGKRVHFLVVAMIMLLIPAGQLGYAELVRHLSTSRQELKKFEEMLKSYEYQFAPDLQERVFISNEILAVRLNAVEALDWCLLDMMARGKKLDINPLFESIRVGAYDRVIIDLRVRTEMEKEIFLSAKRGPYFTRYADSNFVEFVRR